MTRPKHIPPKANGRPKIDAYDSISKPCQLCGRIFYLRDHKFQSYNKFQKRRFCSVNCANEGKVEHKHDGKAYIFERITVTESGCWNWNLRRHAKGYGLAHRNGKDFRAHRYAYEAWFGEIPQGMMVLHSCDNPPCCNPDHLRIGTARDNMMDAINRGRAPQFLRRKKNDLQPNH